MKRIRATPSFFWQGLTIILPVAVLALVGWISLREDEQRAETEARKRAAANAQSLAQAMRVSVEAELHRYFILENVWEIGLRSASQGFTSTDFPEAKLQAEIQKWERDYPGRHFTELAMRPADVLADGRQIWPPYFPIAPQPPKWFGDLTPAQRKLWALLRAGGAPNQIESWRVEFADSKPSVEAQQAVFDLLQKPEQMTGHSNFLPSETGISFEEIALYRLLTATNAQLSAPLLQSIMWQAIDRQSIVSAGILDRACGLSNHAAPELQQKFHWMQEYFADQSKTRGCLDALRHLPDFEPWKVPRRAYWTKNRSALAIFEAMDYGNQRNDSEGRPLDGHGYQVWLAPRSVIEAIFDRAFAEYRLLVPEYATTAITVEGLPIPDSARRDIGRAEPLLGSSEQTTGNPFAGDGIRFDVNFYLASREQMLAAERRRAKLFGTLILVAALTALAGLFSARRAFRRQLQLNEQKSNFVSSVSHELRAPIASVRLMAENLERGKISGPAKQGEYFRFIVQECRRLSSLIENVLDISRIEQGRKQYEFEPTNMVALAEATVKLMEPYAAEKGVELKFETADARPASIQNSTPSLEPNVDGRAIQQALVNLIDNAVKHSPRGETITVGIASGASGTTAKGALQRDNVEVTATPQDGKWTGEMPVLLYVADHGPGIPKDEQEKIFERFYRLGSELRRETQGVGIGLSVVKHIVEAHGGRVGVESEVGRGSRFTIELPTHRPE